VRLGVYTGSAEYLGDSFDPSAEATVRFAEDDLYICHMVDRGRSRSDRPRVGDPDQDRPLPDNTPEPRGRVDPVQEWEHRRTVTDERPDLLSCLLQVVGLDAEQD
jgi:hypothetical protein